jgi:hypothetical protein
MTTTPTLATCRLCQGTLREGELEQRICSVCETYAAQMGVRSPKALDAMINELASESALRRDTH